jgi:uncharacterized membrane protein
MVMMLWHVSFCVFRNKDDDISKVDVIEEFEDEASTKKKKGKKEKKRKKDYDDDDDDGDIEDLAKELDGVTIEQRKKDKKQSKVSGMYIYMYVCMYVYVCMYICAYIHVCVCLYVCVYMCVCVCMCVYICVRVRVCVPEYKVRIFFNNVVSE